LNAPLVGIDPSLEIFSTNAQRIANQRELNELMAPGLIARTVAQWLVLFDEAGVPAGQVKTIDQVYDTEQVRQQGLVWTGEHTTLGKIELPGSPLRYGRSTVSMRLAPPVLGEHSTRIREELGGDV
jgi:crotonobetainyl-CoA:carnitine CoA-transferase CaiB-like acyl-CoA transferase